MIARRLIYVFGWKAWIGLGLLSVLIGAIIFVGAHAAVPAEISGTLEHAKEIHPDGSYAHTDVTLVGDPNTYSFERGDMTPAGVDNNFWTDGKVDLWVDQGTTNIIAIQLYGKDDKTPTKYVSDYYVHPQAKIASDRQTGEIAGGLGVAFLLAGIAMRGRRKAPRERTTVGDSNWPNAGFQNAYGQPQPPEAYIPQRPGYGHPPQQMGWQQPHQPSYGPPSQYEQPNNRPPSQYGQAEQYGQPPYPQQGQYGQPGPQSGWGRQQPPPHRTSHQPDQDGWGR